MSSNRRAALRRHSILLMVLLTIVTFGFYVPSWFLMRRRGINSLTSSEKLETYPFIIAIVLLGANFWFDAAAKLVDQRTAQTFSLLGFAANLGAGITLLVQVFKVRRMLEDHLQDSSAEIADMPNLRHSESSLSGLATFFFQTFYLQYVINNRVIPADQQSAVADGR